MISGYATRKTKMKKLILAISLLLAAGSAAAFENNDIGIIVKAGTSFDNDSDNRGGKTTSVVLSIMKDNCQNCFAPFIIHLDSSNFDGSNINDGIGADYIYKFQHPSNDGYYLALGGALFSEPLNYESASKASAHVGVGMEASGLVLSADMYHTIDSNDNDETFIPLYMLSVGWHF